MSIECQQVGYLKALPFERAGLPDVPYVSLTEVVCCAIYGTPMTPGYDGSLSKLKSACFYLRLMLMGPPVKKSAAEIIFGDEPTTINISSRIEELASELTGEIPEWLLPLVNSFIQTGQRFDKIFEWFAINDDQFAVLDEALTEPTRRFYRQLSHAAASGRVVLLGIRRGGDRGMDCTHEQIDPKNFIGKKVHDLDANELREPKKPNAPAALPPSASNVPNSLNWTDVKVSLAHATMLSTPE